MAETRTIKWLPLESNPDVINKYVKALGVPPDWQFVDVWSIDPDLLAMVPRPVLAVLLLYPISEKSESMPNAFGTPKDTEGVYFMKQTIGNACGTVGLIHALCNNAKRLGLDDSKHLKQFISKTGEMSPETRGEYLETDMAFSEAHEESAQEGQTQAPSRDDKVDLHFVAFVQHENVLYELDGRKDKPVSHGSTTADTLLEDAAVVVKKFMERDPENLNFTIVALAKQEC